MYQKEQINQKYIIEELIKADGFCIYKEKPFLTVSGLTELFILDHRVLYFSSTMRNFLTDSMVRLILENFGIPDVIVGVAIGALPLATMVADKLGLPLAYVRPQIKKYARKRLVEGIIPEGAKTIIIEDVVIKATSSIRAYHAIQAKNASVLGIVSIYNQKLDSMFENLEEVNLRNVSIYDIDVLLEHSKAIGFLNDDRYQEIQDWRKDPENFLMNTLNK
ncbi:MAG: phosphoribosyltransferase family protein [Candidatus Dojkabacteria bacterium]|jgi:orotate phosphoribosyltransferase|nr:phosphoribosyltransferase family protein [Candidatus Dojkabacteria bacterium]